MAISAICLERLFSHMLVSRVTLYTAGHLHTAVPPLFTQPCPHCSHSRAPIVHTAVPRENNGHGCVYLRCRAVCKLPGCVEGHPCVYTPWRRRRNALGAPRALCALRRCAVTTLCTPRARHERSVTTQSIAGQNSVGARWHAVGAPG